jgi:hypothetical protein
MGLTVFVFWGIFAIVVVVLMVLPSRRSGLSRGKVREGNERKCPYCAESNKPEAILCKNCGRDLGNPYDAGSPQAEAWARGMADRQRWHTSDDSAR